MTHKPSPNKSPRRGHKPKLIVIHGDAGETDAGTVSWVTSSKSQVSYHYFIGRDGTVYNFVSDAENAWHAGESKFHGEEIGNTVNPISLGVAFANNGKGDEFYTKEQYKAGGKLVAELCKAHGIPLHRVRGHSEVSPGRKTDPWPWFNWRTFYLWFAFHTADRKDLADWERWADFEK